MPIAAADEWEEVDPAEWEEVGAPPPPRSASIPEFGARPSLSAHPIERLISGALTERLAAGGETLVAAKDYAVRNADEILAPGGTIKVTGDLLKALFNGLQAGSEERFTKMFEQYDRGGLNDRGPDGNSLTPVGQAIAGVVPGVGPRAAEGVERGMSGDVAGAVGQVGGDVVSGELLRKLFQSPPQVMSRSNGKYAAQAATRQAERDALMARNRDADFLNQETRTAQIAEAERIRRMRQENIPTDVQAVNEAAGVRDADIGKRPENMRNPARGAMRTGVVDPDNPGAPADIYKKAKGKLGELQAEKNALLNSPVVAATRSEVTNLAKSFDSVIKAARDTDPYSVKPLKKIRRVIREFVEDRPARANSTGGVVRSRKARFQQDLSPADVEIIRKRVATEIRRIPDKALRTDVGRHVGDFYSKLDDMLDKAVGPDLARINTDLKDLIGLKSASGRKTIAAQAEGAPRPKKVPEPGQLPESMQARVELPPDPVALREAQAAKAAGQPLTPEQEAMLRIGGGLALKATGIGNFPGANWALMRYLSEKLRGQ